MDPSAPIHRMAEVIMSDAEIERRNMLVKMKGIDAARAQKQQIKQTKYKLKVLKQQVKEDRALKKRSREAESKKYIQKEIGRVKKAKYSLNE